jgi:hypothetical protein
MFQRHADVFELYASFVRLVVLATGEVEKDEV